MSAGSAADGARENWHVNIADPDDMAAFVARGEAIAAIDGRKIIRDMADAARTLYYMAAADRARDKPIWSCISPHLVLDYARAIEAGLTDVDESERA